LGFPSPVQLRITQEEVVLEGVAEREEYSTMFDEMNDAMEEIQESIIEDARKIYSERVIDLWLNPRNMGGMENPRGYGKILGPCGDTMQIFIRIEDDKIIDAKFITDGCGTSIAAGGMATELSIGKNVKEAFKISQEVVLKSLGGLPEESVHCALLASNTLREALRDYLSTKRDPWKKAYQKNSGR